MKVAVNTRLLLKGKLEGLGWFTHEVMRRLVAAHPEDTFYFLFDRPFHADFVFGPNVHPVIVGPPARHPLLFYWWYEWSVPAALKRIQPDVFFSPDNFLSLRSPIPTVLVTHDLAPEHFPEQLTAVQRWYYRRYLPLFNRRADRIVTVSEFTRSDLMALYGIPAEKISVACNACRDIFRPLSQGAQAAVRKKYADGKPYFLFVGAVHPRKNVHRLIEAFTRFKQAANSEALLLIGGRFAWKAGSVMEAWKASPFRNEIRFLGYLDDDKLPEVTAAAFAVTYVSLFEGFGIPLLEAMRCGVPVITSNVSSMPEVAGDAALFVNPEDTEAIAGAMQQLWQDVHLRRQLTDAGLRQALRFSWVRAAGVVDAALRNVALHS